MKLTFLITFTFISLGQLTVLKNQLNYTPASNIEQISNEDKVCEMNLVIISGGLNFQSGISACREKNLTVATFPGRRNLDTAISTIQKHFESKNDQFIFTAYRFQNGRFIDPDNKEVEQDVYDKLVRRPILNSNYICSAIVRDDADGNLKLTPVSCFYPNQGLTTKRGGTLCGTSCHSKKLLKLSKTNTTQSRIKNSKTAVKVSISRAAIIVLTSTHQATSETSRSKLKQESENTVNKEIEILAIIIALLLLTQLVMLGIWIRRKYFKTLDSFDPKKNKKENSEKIRNHLEQLDNSIKIYKHLPRFGEVREGNLQESLLASQRSEESEKEYTYEDMISNLLQIKEINEGHSSQDGAANVDLKEPTEGSN